MRSLDRREFVKLTTLGSLGVIMGCKPAQNLDLIIRNGLVLDGLGGAGQVKDIGIKGNTIYVIDKLPSLEGVTTLDARGKIVCPGFIDIHTHTDTELLVNGKAESKIHQGVTTEIGGNCGSSPFPISETYAAEYHGRLKDKYGLETSWTDLDGFFSAIEERGTSLNYATLTGQGDLRGYVVGLHDTAPDADQLKAMQRVLIESLEQGSFGLSTGLEYAPGSYASTEELIKLTSALSEHGGIYATHMRNEDDRVEEAIEEALRIGRDAGVFTQISHLKACNRNNWHKVDHMLEMIATAQKDQPVLADRYPYDAWGTGLSMFMPLWARQGDTEEVLARLNNADDLKKIEAYSHERAERIGGWDRVMISSCSYEDDKFCEGLTVLEGAAEKEMAPFEFVRSLLLNSNNSVGVVGFAMDEANLHKVLNADFVMVGSDGSAVAPYGKLGTGKPHPRYYGTFPRVLGKYARDENVLSLSNAVKKMTSMPAQSMGFKDRGVLDVGKKADIVIFDAETVIDKATFADPHQYPIGIETVIVNGTVTIKNGEHTGALAGEVLRKA
ncbi:MAG: D-aminoacylase [Candidatus Marinimicrobia bacterium]|nr:D-aminoacylase [Candidatus Neomarinimicrobiota bacterium]MCF7851515.1 D-aminoacylase [Candidatus Neomarinimicrobiota bacterium]